MSSPLAAASIQTIFWDVGGVILTNGWDHTQRAAVLAPLGVDVAAYEALHEEANFFWERGLMTAETFFRKTVLSANPGITFDQIWPLVCAQSGVLNQGCYEILAALKASGLYRLATLNNESRELNAYRLDAFDLRRYFSYFICSGFVHEMKPASGIYRDAIDISGLPAGTALFIDDKAENCAAAEALGMQAIVFRSPTQLAAALADHGISLP